MSDANKSYCASCYTELPEPSEEWECIKCGKHIQDELDYLNEFRMQMARERVQHMADQWSVDVRRAAMRVIEVKP